MFRFIRLVEIMNFVLFIVTNLFSLVLLCFKKYPHNKKRNGETRSLEVLDKDIRRSKPQAPRTLQTPQPPISRSNPPPTIASFNAPHSHGSRYGIRPPPIEANAFEIKPSLIRMIQGSKFLGLELEDPYDHLNSFERLCSTFRIDGVPDDSIKLILFPFSLGEKARRWERAIPSHLVNSWDDCTKIFLQMFYPKQKTVQIRRNILEFKQGIQESFHEAWERLKGYTRSCPHHRISQEHLLGIFYRGTLEKYRRALDTASYGRFENLNVNQGEQLIDNFAQSDSCYGGDYDRDLSNGFYGEDFDGSMRSSGGYEDQTSRELKILSEKVDRFLQASQRQINYVGDFYGNQSYQTYKSQEPPPSQIPQEDTTIIPIREMLEGQAKVYEDIERMFVDVHNKMDDMCGALNPKINILASYMKTTDLKVAQASSNNKRPMESSPTSSETNPKGFCNMMSDHKREVDEIASLLFDENIEDVVIKSDEKLKNVTRGNNVVSPLVGKEEAVTIQACPTQMKFHLVAQPKNEEVLDGDCLEFLFKESMNKEVMVNPLPKKSHPLTLELPPHITLTPSRHLDGTVEYAIKFKRRASPFSSIKAILSPNFKEKGQEGVEALMKTVLTLAFKDQHCFSSPLPPFPKNPG